MSVHNIGRRELLASAGLLATPTGVRAEARKPTAVIRTDHGAFTVELEVGRAPLSCANFLRYVEAGKYDGGAFFRATRTPGAPAEGTIVGRPALRSHPFPPIAHESTTRTGLRHTTGVISLGRFEPGSATGDIFICLGPQPYLDARPGAPGDNLGFAAFGRVLQGLAVVRRIHGLPANGPSPYPDQKGQWLNPPVAIVSARRGA